MHTKLYLSLSVAKRFDQDSLGILFSYELSQASFQCILNKKQILCENLIKRYNVSKKMLVTHLFTTHPSKTNKSAVATLVITWHYFHPKYGRK